MDKGRQRLHVEASKRAMARRREEGRRESREGSVEGQHRSSVWILHRILFGFRSDTQVDFNSVQQILAGPQLSDRPCSGAGDTAADKTHRPPPASRRRLGGGGGHPRRRCYTPFISQVTKPLLREGQWPVQGHTAHTEGDQNQSSGLELGPGFLRPSLTPHPRSVLSTLPAFWCSGGRGQRPPVLRGFSFHMQLWGKISKKEENEEYRAIRTQTRSVCQNIYTWAFFYAETLKFFQKSVSTKCPFLPHAFLI